MKQNTCMDKRVHDIHRLVASIGNVLSGITANFVRVV